MPLPQFDKPNQRYGVLVVEDSLMTQHITSWLLEGGNCDVRLALGGEEAVALARDTKFDAILMDIKMPNVDGFEATARIRLDQFRNAAWTPIIAITAFTSEYDRRMCLAAGMDEYIAKPVDTGLPQLVRKIVDALPSQHQSAPLTTPEALLAKAEGDPQFLSELTFLFSAEAKTCRLNFADAMLARDYEAASRAAHKLKGMVLNFTKTGPATTLQEIERSTERSNVTSLFPLIDRANRELIQLCKELHDATQIGEQP